QIEIMRHRRELPSNAAQREKPTTIKHKCCRRSDSSYNALMVRPRGRKAKQLAANRECQNSGLSQKRAQPRAQSSFQAFGKTGSCREWAELGRRQFGSAMILSGQGARTRFGVLRISVKISDLRASCARMERFSTLLGGFPGPTGLDLHAALGACDSYIT